MERQYAYIIIFNKFVDNPSGLQRCLDESSSIGFCFLLGVFVCFSTISERAHSKLKEDKIVGFIQKDTVLSLLSWRYLDSSGPMSEKNLLIWLAIDDGSHVLLTLLALIPAWISLNQWSFLSRSEIIKCCVHTLFKQAVLQRSKKTRWEKAHFECATRDRGIIWTPWRLMSSLHDDVIKWKHFSRYWPFVWGIPRSPVNSPHKGQWRGALMFSLICVWINSWINNRKAGDLRRYQAHYDVIVMNSNLLWSYRITAKEWTNVENFSRPWRHHVFNWPKFTANSIQHEL